MSYRFHPIALEQQEAIWFYTYETWGVDQADRYIAELHGFIEGLCREPNSPRIKRVPVSFEDPVYVARYRHHYVYFKWASSESDTILVLSLLHESMDLPMRLRETLSRIQAGGH
jgi:plasmid stabilization system protein ParE